MKQSLLIARRVAVVILGCIACSFSRAQPVLITAPQTVGPQDVTITATAGGNAVNLATADITVRGATLTVNGRHQIRSLIIERSGTVPGIVTHADSFSFDYSGGANTDVVFGCELVCTGSVFVQGPVGGVASRIDVSGRGYAGGDGPGAGTYGTASTIWGAGGGYGGEGGSGAARNAGGLPYGSLLTPSLHGSGGGISNGQVSTSAGRGGGSLRLIVSGSLTLDGSIQSNGTAGSSASGGGSGGSVWITATTLTGTGSVTANGGSAADSASGSGSGGRIAVQSAHIPSSITYRATSSSGGYDGAAGTVRFYSTPTQTGKVVVDNGGLGFGGQATILDSDIVYNELEIKNRGVVAHPAGAVNGLTLRVEGDARITSEGRIDVSGRGYTGGAGPGAGTNGTASTVWGAGGGYGGEGGSGSVQNAGGLPYGSLLTPLNPGSGGGIANGQATASAGRGGGVLRMIVNGTLTLDGTIQSNGTAGSNACGGGSGGSVWITASSLDGGGSINANGGSAADSASGSGSGGRIAVQCDEIPSSIITRATSSSAGYDGAAGTVRLYSTPAATGRVIVDNGGLSYGQATILDSSIVYDELEIRNNGVVAHPVGVLTGLTLLVQQNASIHTGGRIDVSGRGHKGGEGLGAGANGTVSTVWGAGGGYGGEGGTGSLRNTGGSPYGSLLTPLDAGSGGGIANGQPSTSAGRGGGALRLIVNGTLTLNGEVHSNGSAGINACGGGSGGSVWITASTLSGEGLVQANGGSAADSASGSGSGGRIAIQSALIPSSIITRATSSSGGYEGAAGTVRLYSLPSRTGRVIVDNGGLSYGSGQATYLDSDIVYDELEIRNQGVVAHPPGATGGLTLQVEGNAKIVSGGRIDVSGRGYAGGAGPGAGTNGTLINTWGAGGGFGGEGGSGNLTNAGGKPYGYVHYPLDAGSGGGIAKFQPFSSAGRGGGVVRLVVNGTLTLNGEIYSNGSSGSNACGGGSGGSVWISASSVVGLGSIHAKGGNAADSASGSGSGGRIAVDACTLELSAGRISAAGGTAGYDGCPGTVSLRHLGVRTISISTNDECVATLIDGTVAQQVARANQPPPPINGAPWQEALRQRDGYIGFVYDNCTQSQLPGASYMSTHTPIIGVDEVTLNNCNSAFYRFTFDLPAGFTDASLQGIMNADDMAVVWLNGNRISAPADAARWNQDYSSACAEAITWSYANGFMSQVGSHFVTGTNELVVAVLGKLSVPPTGLEFDARMQYRVIGTSGSPLVITEQPRNQLSCVGQDARFTVAATGFGYLWYQWEKDGVAIDGWENPTAYSPTLEILGVQAGDLGEYTCIVENGCGSIRSRGASLLICPGDFNCDGGIDGDDVGAFFTEWEQGGMMADMNDDGGIDGSDVSVFFMAWEGGC